VGPFAKTALGCLAAAIAISACGSSGGRHTLVTPSTEVRAPEQPSGAYTKVANGTNEGLSWRLSKAPNKNGDTCWKLETGPSVDLIQSAVMCDGAPKSGVGADFNTDFPFETGATTPHDIAVGLVHQAIQNAQFQFIDPTTKNITTAKPTFIDKQNGTVVWAGKSKPYLAAATITLADGSKIDCGPGDIQSAQQLSDKTEAQILQKRQFVWTCISE
jgi:hypothetical protein